MLVWPPCQHLQLNSVQLEEQRRRNEPPSEMELVRRAEKDALHAKALASQQDQRDEVKAMNAMLAYAKCAAIRYDALLVPWPCSCLHCSEQESCV